MTQVARPPDEHARKIAAITRTIAVVSRALVIATRSWVMYPPDHPAVAAALERLRRAIGAATAGMELQVAVVPDGLLFEGDLIKSSDLAIAEAAALLHVRNIIEVTFAPDIEVEALSALLDLLKLDPEELRERGGPVPVWAETGHTSIAFRQIDFKKVLEDRQNARATRRDDLWYSIVRSMLDRRKSFDEEAQKRLREIAGDSAAIAQLAGDVMEPARTPDGSPLIATQAAAVLTAYRHIANVMAVTAPEELTAAMRNMADATAALEPSVAIELMRGDDNRTDPADVDLLRGVAGVFDEDKIARLLATSLALQGCASERLARVLSTMATDEERQTRVLTLTRSILAQRLSREPQQFKSIWGSMEELVVQYNEQKYISADYRTTLQSAAGRAEAMAGGAMPPELNEWMQTVEHDSIRRLSVTLLVDLLRLERDPAQAHSLVEELGAIAEDLMLAADYDSALDVATILSSHAKRERALAHEAARRMMLDLARSTAVREAIGMLDVMDDRQYEAFRKLCPALGAATIETLHKRLLIDEDGTSRLRTIEIIASFSAEAIAWLAPLEAETSLCARCNLAELLGRIATSNAVPLLRPLLMLDDRKVLAEAARSLARIDDPSAARAIHTALRTKNAVRRKGLVETLASLKERRTVPMLVQILDESDALGDEHDMVLDTVGALEAIADDRAVPAVSRMMRRRKWFASRKVRALRQACVAALAKMASPKATAALTDAAHHGDRMLRRLAASGLAGAGATP